MSNKKITDLSSIPSLDPAVDVLQVDDVSASTSYKVTRNGLLGITSAPLGTTDTQSPTNKTFDNTNALTLKDTNFTLQDDGDTTKQAKFQLSGITTATTRTFTFPNATTTLVGTDATQTLTNKTLTSPTINTPTIVNPTLQTDTVSEYTSANGVTIDGLNIKDSKLNTNNSVVTANITDNAITATKMGTPYACSLYKSAAQSINNTTFTAVTFNSEIFDTGSLHDTVTNNSRVTIPSGYDGYWLVNASVNFQNAAASDRIVAIYKNGVTWRYNRNYVGANATHSAWISEIMLLSAADYIEIFAYQSSGGALNVQSGLPGAAADVTVFQMTFLGKT